MRKRLESPLITLFAIVVLGWYTLAVLATSFFRWKKLPNEEKQ